MRHASLTLCQCIWKSIWLRVELHCDIYFVCRSFPLRSFSSFSLASPPSLCPHSKPSLHVLLFEQLPVHKVNLSLLRNSTLIFEIDKHFCVLQLGVAGGQGAGSKGFTVKSCALPVAFFFCFCCPCSPLAFQLAAGITFFCCCIVRGVAA